CMDCRMISMDATPNQMHLFIEGSTILAPNKIIGKKTFIAPTAQSLQYTAIFNIIQGIICLNTQAILDKDRKINKAIEEYIAEQNNITA
ncbi:MAG: hypothetical protein QW139_02905, partial [Candidatus Micrarchaeaceae archaeon]